MRTAIKLISVLIVLCALFFGLSVLVLTKLVNPNDYKTYLDQYVYAKTQRHLLIKGDISWSFIPWLGIDIKQVELSNPLGFEGQPNVAKIGEVKATVRFWPLFSGKVELGKVIIDHANINIIKNAAGKTNWGNWNKINNAAQRMTGIKPEQAPDSSNSVPVHQLDIAGIDVDNATIRLFDQQTHQTTTITDFNLTANSVSLERNFPLQMNFLLQESNSTLKVTTKAHATANIDLKNQRYKLNQLVVNTKIERPELPIILVNLNGNIMADLSKQTISLSLSKLQLANMDIKGGLQITQLSAIPVWSTTLAANQVALGPLLQAIQGKSFIQGNLSFQTSLTTEGNNAHTLLQNLNGKGDLNISNGTFLGLNIVRFLEQAEAIIKQKPLTNLSGQTSFSSITGTYTIHHGVLTNNDLKLNGVPIAATGSGTVNLNDDMINYMLTTQYLGNAGGQAKFELPIIITGNLAHPNVKPNYNSLVKQTFEEEVKNKLEQYSGNLGSFLKGI